ncbi:alpha/beta hydrolase family protein [Enemella sp. A6]|uniref:alpha/beta hydrolase family protein n=1 Tax=Enemella sp. A6 TaxID=3440152 RepID=UPI003EB7F23F
MSELPYGTWPSPLAGEDLTGIVTPAEPQLDGSWLWWLESRPDEGGRTSLWRRDVTGGGVAEEITPGSWNVRSRVHEYGGGAYATHRTMAVISDITDGRLWLFEPGNEPRPITAEGADVRYGDLRLLGRQRLVVAVREDHRVSGEPVNTIVAIDLDAKPGFGTILCAGADFYASPEVSTDERIAWCEWDHPSMPWDATRIMVAGFRRGPQGLPVVTDPFAIAGGDDEAAIHPRWIPGEGLLYLTDRDGFWNLHRWTDDSHDTLLLRDADFSGPMWQLGQDPYAVVDGETVVCSWWTDGQSTIGTLDLTSGEFTALDTPACGVSALVGSAGRCAALVQHRNRGPALVVLDLDDRQWSVLRRFEVPLPRESASVPTALTWRNQGHKVHGWLWRPHLPGHTGPDDELPPLRVICHGGPTGHMSASLDLTTQYWTTRGYAVLGVNYSGSTGYGRDYRQRLRGQWGVLDVSDCISGAQQLIDDGEVDPARVSIEGGSAGGFTTLQALCTTNLFAAGISRFGVADPTMLARDTHKFESRYLESLIGPYPEQRDLYQERSPLLHADRLSAPVLLLQGADDKIVPLNQAEALAEAARAAGLQHALVVFEGEGHGFRKAESVIAAVQAEESFLSQLYGFTPAAEVPELELR